MPPSQRVKFASTFVVCAPKRFSVIPPPNAAPRPSLFGRCISTIRMSKKASITKIASSRLMRMDMAGGEYGKRRLFCPPFDSSAPHGSKPCDFFHKIGLRHRRAALVFRHARNSAGSLRLENRGQRDLHAPRLRDQLDAQKFALAHADGSRVLRDRDDGNRLLTLRHG